MEFPSIKLNIFKKLEYFLELREFNRKFNSQFKNLKSSGWKDKEEKFVGAYPSWEIEKKILFWTYIFHEHLGRPITAGHFKGMFISDAEYGKIGVKKIFENLEINGFGKKEVKKDKDNKEKVQFFINSKGLTYGELLWYLYKLKKYKIGNSKEYIDIFQTNYQLTRCSFGIVILCLQLVLLHLFVFLAGYFFTFEFLDKIGLLDNLKNMVINKFYHPNIFIVLIILPMSFFILSIILDFGYRLFIVKNKYIHIKKLRK